MASGPASSFPSDSLEVFARLSNLGRDLRAVSGLDPAVLKARHTVAKANFREASRYIGSILRRRAYYEGVLGSELPKIRTGRPGDLLEMLFVSSSLLPPTYNKMRKCYSIELYAAHKRARFWGKILATVHASDPESVRTLALSGLRSQSWWSDDNLPVWAALATSADPLTVVRKLYRSSCIKVSMARGRLDAESISRDHALEKRQACEAELAPWMQKFEDAALELGRLADIEAAGERVGWPGGEKHRASVRTYAEWHKELLDLDPGYANEHACSPDNALHIAQQMGI